MYLTTHSKHFNGQIWEWSTWSIAGALVVCLMRVPSETNLKNLTRSRLKGRNDGYFRPTNFKFHYVAPQFFIFRRTVQIAPNFRHWNAHIFLFWLNPTRHSKLHNTPKHRFRSDCSYSLVPVGAAGPPLPPLFFSCPGERNRRRPVSVRVTGVRYSLTYNKQSTPGFKHWAMLLMFTENKVTNRMLPWGTPISCRWESEKVDPTRTLKDLSFKTFAIKMGGSS